MTADRTGVARSLRLYLDASSGASKLVLGALREGQRRSRARCWPRVASRPTAGGWNAVELETGVPLVAGRPYWIGLLNPLGSRARCAGATARVSGRPSA